MNCQRTRYLALAIFPLISVRLIADDVIVTRNVNLRPDPSTAHSPLLLLKPSDRLTLLEPGQTNGYFHVRTTSLKEGWVRTLNVRIVPPQPQVTPLVATPVESTRPVEARSAGRTRGVWLAAARYKASDIPLVRIAQAQGPRRC